MSLRRLTNCSRYDACPCLSALSSILSSSMSSKRPRSASIDAGLPHDRANKQASSDQFLTYEKAKDIESGLLDIYTSFDKEKEGIC